MYQELKIYQKNGESKKSLKREHIQKEYVIKKRFRGFAR